METKRALPKKDAIFYLMRVHTRHVDETTAIEFEDDELRFFWEMYSSFASVICFRKLELKLTF